MSEQDGSVSRSELLIIFFMLLIALFIIGWSHQSQLKDLQRRVGELEQRR